MSDPVAGGSWLMVASALQSFPVIQAVPHVDNITRREALGSLCLTMHVFYAKLVIIVKQRLPGNLIEWAWLSCGHRES